MMKKQMNKTFFKAVLLTLAVLMLLAFSSTAIVAASNADKTHTLIFTFNSDDVSSVTVTYPGLTEPTVMVSGQALHVPANVNVTVIITPRQGYRVEYLADDMGNKLEKSPLQNNACIWEPIQSDFSATIVCEERTYDVIALDYDGDRVLSYVVDDGSMSLDDLTNGSLKYRYKDSEQRTVLPNVSKPGYTFEGWKISLGNNDTRNAEMSNKVWCIPIDIVSDKIDQDGIVYVYPDLRPIMQDVYREDRVYKDDGDHLGGFLTDENNPVQWSAPTDSVIDALAKMAGEEENGYKTYPGYTMLGAVNSKNYEYQKITVYGPSDLVPTPNYLYRLYIANIYSLTYEGVDSYTGVGQYVYGQRTAIADPTRRGYDFSGWLVKLTVGGEEKEIFVPANPTSEGTSLVFSELAAYYEEGVRIDPNAKFAADVDENGKGTITLVAQWTPIEYNIEYDWNDEARKELLDELNGVLLSDFSKLVFDSDFDDAHPNLLLIPAPVRPGYTFKGWNLTYVNDAGETVTLSATDLVSLYEDGRFLLSTNTYVSDLILQATWEAEKYTVVLDPGFADAVAGKQDKLYNVVYDETLTLLEDLDPALLCPIRDGYDFLGFYSKPNGEGVKYINIDGTSTGEIWREDDGDDSGTVTLYAHWRVCRYNMSIQIEDANGAVGQDVLDRITVSVIPENEPPFMYTFGEQFDLEFASAFNVIITLPDGYKVVTLDGKAVDHSSPCTLKLTVEAWKEGHTFVVKMLPKLDFEVSVEANVDYRKEAFKNLLPGKYKVIVDGVATYFTVDAGETGAIRSEWFGKTVALVRCGDGIESADSDPVPMTLAPRPAQPYLDSGNADSDLREIESYDYSFIVVLADGVAEGKYEFAIAEFGSNAVLVWQTSNTLEGLKPGTKYNIYIRLAATDTAPHGEELIAPRRTATHNYKQQMLNELDSMLDENSGKTVKKLIEDTKAKINAVPVEDGFYETVENLMNAVRTTEFALATKKDEALAQLQAVYTSCKNAGLFDDTNKALLDSIYANAVNAIEDAMTVDEVTQVYDPAVKALRAVPVKWLEDADNQIRLESQMGLDQTSVLTLLRENREVEFAALSQLISKAIRTSGMVAAGSFTTQAEAEKLLRSLDVAAYYYFSVSPDANIKDGDQFTVTLQIPEDLRGMTGLQVAYYNQQTGVIELLKSEVSDDGKTITFYTTYVANFVLLADPTVELTGIIAALSALLLCQIIALALILVSRSKAKKNTLHASVALPITMLTVHFSPVNGEVIALILGAAVVVMQIVLIVLLLKSDMIHKSVRSKHTKEVPATETPAVTSEDTVSEPLDTTGSADPDPTDADYDAEFAATVAYGAMTASEEATEENDPFVMYDDDPTKGDTIDTEDFIEPAAATQYSLMDEDIVALDDESLVTDEDALPEEGTDTDDMGMFFGADDEDVVYTDETYPDAEYPTEAYADDGYTEDAAYAEEQEVEEIDLDEDLSDEEYFFGTTTEEPTDAPADEENDPLYHYDE